MKGIVLKSIFLFGTNILLFVSASTDVKLHAVQSDTNIIAKPREYSDSRVYSKEQVRFLSSLYNYSCEASSQDESYKYHFAFIIRAATLNFSLVQRLWNAATREGSVPKIDDLANEIYRSLDHNVARRCLRIMAFSMEQEESPNLSYKQAILNHMRKDYLGQLLEPEGLFKLLRSVQNNNPDMVDSLPSWHRTITFEFLQSPGDSEAKWSLFWVAFANYYTAPVYKMKNSQFFWKSLAFSIIYDITASFPGICRELFGFEDELILSEMSSILEDKFEEKPGYPKVDHFKEAAVCGHVPTLKHILNVRREEIHHKRADLALFHAADNGQVEAAIYLLNCGVLNLSWKTMQEVLAIANSAGYDEIIEIISAKSSFSIFPRTGTVFRDQL